MKFIKNISFKKKLFFMIVALVIVFITFLTIYLPGKLKQIYLEQLENKVATISNIASFSIAAGVFFKDNDAVVEGTAPIVKDPNIVFLIVENDEGDNLYNYAFNNNFSYLQNRLHHSPAVYDSLIVVSSPILFKDKIIGTIYTGYSLRPLHESVNSSINDTLLLGVPLLVIGILLATIFGNIATRPINDLVKSVKHISDGNLEFHPDIKTKDELGYLSNEISKMVESISVSKSRDEKKNIELVKEIHVRKRVERDLVKAKEAAEKADKLKSEFLAQISHEIRTPLNTILSNLSLIEMNIKDNISSFDKYYADYFLSIQNGSTRLIRTVDLVLNMSQLESGSYDVNYEIINIYNSVFTPILMEFSQKAKRKNINLELSFHNPDAEIFADRYTVTQIFANLVDNAIKYTDRGSIIIHSETINGYVTVHVKDTGIGISAEYLPHIFKKFSQEEQGYCRTFEGNGLGLALVKKYCDLNNAAINVESKKGEGSTFIVKFKNCKNN